MASRSACSLTRRSIGGSRARLDYVIEFCAFAHTHKHRRSTMNMNRSNDALPSPVSVGIVSTQKQRAVS
jgi:hypothetical protein